MSQSTGYATLIVVSLLSCESCAGLSTKRHSNESEVEGGMLDNILRGASIALAITFTVATTLPPTSLALALDFGASEPSEAPQDSPERNDDKSVCTVGEAYEEANRKPNLPLHASTTDKVDREDVRECVQVYPIVDGNDVKTSWMRRSRSRVARKPGNSLQLIRQTLQSVKEVDDVPLMELVDSFASLSSFSTISTRSSTDFISLAPTKITGLRQYNMSPQPNAEWAIIE